MVKAIKNIFIPSEIELSNGKKVKPKKSVTPYVIILLTIAIYISVQITGFKMSVLIERGNQFFIILKEMILFDYTYIPYVLEPVIETVKMSIVGTVIGCFFALPVAVISSNNINSSKLILVFTRIILSLVRTIPVLITALIMTYIFGIGTFAGTIAIGIFSFGIVTKMLYEQIETVNMDAYMAIQSTGASKIRAFFNGVMPQILPSFLSISLYTFEINVRNAAILGYVGAGGIGLLINERIGWRDYDKVGAILVVLFITVILIEVTSRYLRKRLT